MTVSRGRARDATRCTVLAALLSLTPTVAAPLDRQPAATFAQPPAKKPPVSAPAKAPPAKAPPVKAPPAKAPTVRKPQTPPAVASTLPAAPNIVVLLVDDLGWQDWSVPLFSVSTEANRRYTTPAMARLAREGVAFTNAYASAPVGTPSVVALLTGRAPMLTRVTDDSLSLGHDDSGSLPGLLSPAWNYAGLNASPKAANSATAPSLPALLRTAGYRTAYAGTPRWSATGAIGADARAVGFDEPSASAMPLDSIAFTTIRAIDAARVAKKPAFVLVAFEAPPPRRIVSAGASGVARSRDASDALDGYVAHVERIDARIGQILAHLDSAPPGERTIVVLLSDNGGRSPGAFPNAPLRGRMGAAYEGGMRIPFVVRWPSVAQRGLRSATPVIIDDLFPTLLRAGRVPNIAVHMRGALGRDLTSTLDNSRSLAADRPLFWHYPHAGDPRNEGAEPFSAIRSGPWKLIYFYANSRYELYNLTDDVGESRELSLRQSKIAAPLSEQLRAALAAANAQMPIDSVYRKPVSLPGRLLVLRELP